MSDVHFSMPAQPGATAGKELTAMQGAAAVLSTAIEKELIDVSDAYWFRYLIYHTKKQLLSDRPPPESLKG